MRFFEFIILIHFHFPCIQVTKLIEDATSNKVSKTAIDYKTILHWLVENKVLSIALEGKDVLYQAVLK